MLLALDSETQDGKAIWLGSPIAEVEPKCWKHVLGFLRRSREYIAWNSDYDVQAILKWLPLVYLERLQSTGSCHFGDVVIKYVPRKFCKFWWKDPASDKKKLITVIYDLKQFYGCGLDAAARKLKLPRKDSIPKSWYKRMAEVLNDPKTRQTVLDYARQDVAVLQAILERTQQSFTKAGLVFVRPVSCASFAERVFKNELATGRCPKPVQRAARQAYFGGRIECLRTGRFHRAWESDIHSAYPSEISKLKAADGEWRTDLAYVRSDASYAYVHCAVDIPDDLLVGPIPVRHRENYIYYPVGRFRATLTLGEFLHVEKYVTKILKVTQMIHGSGDLPFKRVTKLYEERLRNPEAGYAIKIILNALYGKTAQKRWVWHPTRYVDRDSVFINDQFWRRREKFSQHTSFVYASEITSRIRLRMITETPLDQVIFFATDAVMTKSPVRMENTGPGLGQWSEPTEVENLCVIGAGVYQYEQWNDDQELIRKTKFRGFDVRFGEFSPILNRAGNRHSVSFNVTRNTSMKQSVDPMDFNVLRDVARKMNVNFDRKRLWPKRWTARELLNKQFDSRPWMYTPTFYISSSALEELEEEC